ncbi:hypothetical protein WJX79_003129 [Trebouxia sp. C0005]
MGKLSWHVESPPPFAFVTPDQQIKPFGRTLGPKHAHLHPSNLRVDDIPGSRPKHHCFTTPPRLTNPLEPDYPLPHHNHPQPAAHVPKFIKDSLDNSDIPGTQASPRIRTQPPSNYVSDIERTSPWHQSNADAHLSKGQFVRPWTAGQAATMPAQAKQLAELDPAAICADAARPEKAFFDDSRPYQRPVQAAASLDVSQRDSPAVRRQKGSLLEDMMTIKRL